MDLTLVLSITALGFALLICIGLVVHAKKFKSVSQHLNELVDTIDELKLESNQFNNLQEEFRTSSYAMLQHTKQLQNHVEQLQKQLEQLKVEQQAIAEQEPQSRFYSKGMKLVSQGATIEDVMRECELPLAEAELLFSLHAGHTTQS